MWCNVILVPKYICQSCRETCNTISSWFRHPTAIYTICGGSHVACSCHLYLCLLVRTLMCESLSHEDHTLLLQIHRFEAHVNILPTWPVYTQHRVEGLPGPWHSQVYIHIEASWLPYIYNKPLQTHSTSSLEQSMLKGVITHGQLVDWMACFAWLVSLF